MKIKSWFKTKTYLHFDLPLSFEEAKDFVTNSESITHHSFLPFISFSIEFRQMNNLEKEKRTKSRPIKYASHKDGYIFAYYAHLLSEKYESFLKNNGLDDVVLAYRSNKGNNITFAKEAFNHISEFGDCIAFGFDI